MFDHVLQVVRGLVTRLLVTALLLLLLLLLHAAPATLFALSTLAMIVVHNVPFRNMWFITLLQVVRGLVTSCW
jgi:cell division protein FtsW (lipid II flippase)